METKSVRIDRFLIEESKRYGFQSMNQYVTYLYTYEQTRRKATTIRLRMLTTRLWLS